MIYLTECPRDAMQGVQKFISTDKKIKYINQLIKVGFHTIDFGSFVSPKAIPQLKDTEIVLNNLDLDNSNSNLLSIIANLRGAKKACDFKQINYLGYPLSISEIFQKKNTNKTINESLDLIVELQDLCIQHNKKIQVYISMAFGNPYNEKWDTDLILELTYKLDRLHVKNIALSDTIGVANKNKINLLFTNLIRNYPNVNFGAHFHSTYDESTEKIKAAYSSGCVRFDSAIKGYGGCPMAADKLVGNIPTEKIIEFFKDKVKINHSELEEAIRISDSVFL